MQTDTVSSRFKMLFYFLTSWGSIPGFLEGKICLLIELKGYSTYKIYLRSWVIESDVEYSSSLVFQTICIHVCVLTEAETMTIKFLYGNKINSKKVVQ